LGFGRTDGKAGGKGLRARGGGPKRRQIESDRAVGEDGSGGIEGEEDEEE
jgi:hypothetical protein